MGTGVVSAPACGVMKLQIKVNDEGVIEPSSRPTAAARRRLQLTGDRMGQRQDRRGTGHQAPLGSPKPWPCRRSKSTARSSPRMRSKPPSTITGKKRHGRNRLRRYQIRCMKRESIMSA